MDSPAGNALAHFLHLALFLLGEQLSDAAYPTEVAAELYRANPIESYDTCALRYSISRGGREVPLIVAFTHACDSAIEPEVTIHCEHGRIRYLAGRHAEICIGTRVEILPLQPDPYPGLLESFRQHYLEQSGAGSHDGRPSPLVATLESARAHVVAVNAAAEAAEIIDIPAEFITEVRLADHATPIRAIDGIVAALTALTSAAGSSGRGLLHESGAFDWTHPAGRMRIPAGYHHFAGPRARAASEPVEHDEAWPMEPAESIPPLGAQA
jgi:hypothetical protein